MAEIKMMRPDNLDIDRVIEENYEIYRANKLTRIGLLYMVDALLRSRANHRKEMDETGNRYAPLWSLRLKGVVHNYQAYLSFLLTTQVILTDNHHIRGEKSRGYCFCYPYNGRDIVVETVSDYKLGKAIRRERDKYLKEIKELTRGYKYLTQWWDNGKLEIDEAGAYSWIDKYKFNRIAETYRKKYPASIRNRKIEEINNTVQDFKYLVRCIKERNYNYRFSGKGHRFYNPISNLKRELRNYLTYNGQPLVEVDIKNSQPFFTLGLLKSTFWEGRGVDRKKTLKFICEDIYEDMKDRECYTRIINLLKTSESQYSIGLQIDRFSDLVLSGSIYEYFMNTFEPFFPGRFNARDKVKKEVLKMFYLNPNEYWVNKYEPFRTFGNLFPGVFKLFNLIKEPDYTYLPIILQRMESHLVIDIVCKEINRQYPELPLYTIHDNIITTKGNEHIVQEILLKEIKNWIGLEPMVSTKELIVSAEAA